MMGRPRDRARRAAAAVAAAVAAAATLATVAMAASPDAPAAAAPSVTLSESDAPTYREGPPTGHTGGFGEPTCAECHFGAPTGADQGVLTVEVPEVFEPGRTYRLAVELAHPEMAAAGFQIAVRFAGEPGEGEQAGTLRSVGPRTTVTADPASGVQYGHQTEDGAVPTGAGTARWVLEWRAPGTAADVAVHVAANAANDDASEFGDVILATSARIGSPALPRSAGARTSTRPGR